MPAAPMLLHESQEEQDAIQHLYEDVVLYKQSLKSKREGFLERALPKPIKVIDQNMCHCVAVTVDFEKERILLVEPLKQELSHFCFDGNRASVPQFPFKILTDLLLHKKFPKHSSSKNRTWLQNCRMMFGEFVNDGNCLSHALTVCMTVVNQKLDMESHWPEARSNQFNLCDSKSSRAS